MRQVDLTQAAGDNRDPARVARLTRHWKARLEDFGPGGPQVVSADEGNGRRDRPLSPAATPPRCSGAWRSSAASVPSRRGSWPCSGWPPRCGLRTWTTCGAACLTF